MVEIIYNTVAIIVIGFAAFELFKLGIYGLTKKDFNLKPLSRKQYLYPFYELGNVRGRIAQVFGAIFIFFAFLLIFLSFPFIKNFLTFVSFHQKSIGDNTH